MAEIELDAIELPDRTVIAYHLIRPTDALALQPSMVATGLPASRSTWSAESI
jgi:hypothetical protein